MSAMTLKLKESIESQESLVVQREDVRKMHSSAYQRTVNEDIRRRKILSSQSNHLREMSTQLGKIGEAFRDTKKYKKSLAKVLALHKIMHETYQDYAKGEDLHKVFYKQVPVYDLSDQRKMLIEKRKTDKLLTILIEKATMPPEGDIKRDL